MHSQRAVGIVSVINNQTRFVPIILLAVRRMQQYSFLIVMTSHNQEAHKFCTFVENVYANGDNVDISAECLGSLNHLDGCSFAIQHVHDLNYSCMTQWKAFLEDLGAVYVNMDVDGTTVHIDAVWEEIYNKTNHNTNYNSGHSYGTLVAYTLWACLFAAVLYACTFVDTHPIQILQWFHYVIRTFFK